MNEIKPPVSKDAHVDQSVRPKRIPLGKQDRMNVDPKLIDRNEFTPRWINDKDDRIQRALQAGYEFVDSDDEPGIPKVAQATKMGKHLTMSVGGGRIAYLMKLKKDWYEEDQAEKQKKVDELEKAMKPKKDKDEYGPGLTNE